jgi:ketosteroid isomerase-like protein
MNLEDAIGVYHRAAVEFSKGTPGPVKAVYSHDDDVTLANPFGSFVSGWTNVSDALDYASSRFRDGDVTGFDRVATYLGDDLACILEREHWRSKVAGREDIAAFDLRVTSTLRREDDAWKLVHRHADPIATLDADGPLRAT